MIPISCKKIDKMINTDIQWQYLHKDYVFSPYLTSKNICHEFVFVDVLFNVRLHLTTFHVCTKSEGCGLMMNGRNLTINAHKSVSADLM